jgi:hypothetical protein
VIYPNMTDWARYLAPWIPLLVPLAIVSVGLVMWPLWGWGADHLASRHHPHDGEAEHEGE